MVTSPSPEPIIRGALRAVLDRVPLGVWQRLAPRDAVRLVYHVVSDEDVPHLRYYAYKDRAAFAADLAYMAEHGGFIGYAELVVQRRRGLAGARQRFLPTFDDGLVECFAVVRPLLRRHGAPAIFFVPTEFIAGHRTFFELRLSLCLTAITALADDAAADLAAQLGPPAGAPPGWLGQLRIAPPRTPAHAALLAHVLGIDREGDPVDACCARLGVDADAYFARRRPFMSWDEVRQLAADGFVVGAHGTLHRRLQTMAADELAREIATSCDVVRAMTGQAKVPFAFPYSGDGIDRGLLRDVMRRYDFVELFFDSGGLRADVPFVIHRLWADPPAGARDGSSNLGLLLRREWSRREVWARSRRSDA